MAEHPLVAIIILNWNGKDDSSDNGEFTSHCLLIRYWQFFYASKDSNIPRKLS